MFGLKQLPPSLQQRLDNVEEKYLDPHLLQGNLYLISWFHFNYFNINGQELDCYYLVLVITRREAIYR